MPGRRLERYVIGLPLQMEGKSLGKRRLARFQRLTGWPTLPVLFHKFRQPGLGN